MRLTFLLAIVFLLAACDNQRLFEDYKDFEKRAWSAKDTARFDFRVIDGSIPYNVLCNIRNSVDYPYSRIFVNYSLEDSSGRVLVKQLVATYLFDLKTGAPFGRSGLGDVYDHRFPLLENYELKPGRYRVKLLQFMREDTLQGVIAAGVRIERRAK